MRINSLKLENIGPFREAELMFIADEQERKNPPVICITGENGTGKSIILDAIRCLFYGRFRSVERSITSSEKFLIATNLFINNSEKAFYANTIVNSPSNPKPMNTNEDDINKIFVSDRIFKYPKNFIFDYWTSKLSSDKFDINSITAIEPIKYLATALSGIHKNIDVAKNIAFFDYLRDSKERKEKELGTMLYDILEQIIDLSIENGKLSHVSRMNLTPIIKIGNNEVALDKLSSGNLYLIQRLTSLLRQVYSICILNHKPIAEYKDIEGVLLIDEAENHLHPKWQKVFLKNILDIFPKLQIIVATHSPFIVSSIENARVYVCKSRIDFSVVEEETDYYNNKPIEEILLSPLFDTSNFGQEISRLITRRKEAIRNNDNQTAKVIKEKLLAINPEYFSYLNLDSLLQSIQK